MKAKISKYHQRYCMSYQREEKRMKVSMRNEEECQKLIRREENDSGKMQRRKCEERYLTETDEEILEISVKRARRKKEETENKWKWKAWKENIENKLLRQSAAHLAAARLLRRGATRFCLYAAGAGWKPQLPAQPFFSGRLASLCLAAWRRRSEAYEMKARIFLRAHARRAASAAASIIKTAENLKYFRQLKYRSIRRRLSANMKWKKEERRTSTQRRKSIGEARRRKSSATLKRISAKTSGVRGAEISSGGVSSRNSAQRRHLPVNKWKYHHLMAKR